MGLALAATAISLACLSAQSVSAAHGPAPAAARGSGAASNLSDSFSESSLDAHKWISLWGSQLVSGGRLELSSTLPASADQTFSSLVVSRQTWGDLNLALDTTTLGQLRQPAPNPWEVSWVFFRYSDLAHYYWLSLKTNGWELGKKDGGALDGTAPQVFLATGTSPTFPVGRRYRVQVTMVGGRVTVTVDGTLLLDAVDPDPLGAGAIGLYEEDSRVAFDKVSVTPAG